MVELLFGIGETTISSPSLNKAEKDLMVYNLLLNGGLIGKCKSRFIWYINCFGQVRDSYGRKT